MKFGKHDQIRGIFSKPQQISILQRWGELLLNVNLAVVKYHRSLVFPTLNYFPSSFLATLVPVAHLLKQFPLDLSFSS